MATFTQKQNWKEVELTSCIIVWWLEHIPRKQSTWVLAAPWLEVIPTNVSQESSLFNCQAIDMPDYGDSDGAGPLGHQDFKSPTARRRVNQREPVVQ